VILGKLAAEGGAVEETIKNAGINTAALLVLGFLLYKDLSNRDKDKARIEREEELASLEVVLPSTQRVATLTSLRGSYRPVVLVGPTSLVNRALRGATNYRAELFERGITFVPVYTDKKTEDTTTTSTTDSLSSSSMDELDKLRAELRKNKNNNKNKDASSSSSLTKMKLDPYDLPRWRAWAERITAEKGLSTTTSLVYAQIQLNGVVRTSGVGTPNWETFVVDLAPKDSKAAQLTG
jgi:hypothetical protein